MITVPDDCAPLYTAQGVFGKLQGLQTLNLKYCAKLVSLPESESYDVFSFIYWHLQSEICHKFAL